MEEAYKDYAFKQLDIKQIAYKYNKSESCIWKNFAKFEDSTKLKRLAEKNINLVMDTIYFGQTFGYMIFRAYVVNLYYQQVHSETIKYLAFLG